MQASTCMKPASIIRPTRPASGAASTQGRLLDAAARLLARDGLHGATTREIAADAGVNEVTLFRHFQSKEKLLGAVFRRVAAEQLQALSFADPVTAAHDLRRDLRRCARRYSELLEKNQALIRAIIGEASRYPQHARRTIHEAIRPFRKKLIGYLEAGKAAGTIRPELRVGPAVDLFTGMILAGMLRRTSQCVTLEYSQRTYLETAVEVFVGGIAATRK